MTWYLRTWSRPSRLWLWRLLILTSLGGLVASTARDMNLNFATGAAVFAALVLPVFGLLFAYPMLRFKPQGRTLEMNSAGLQVSIGKRHARRTWKQIRNVALEGDAVIITGKNNNAFILPLRAFAGPAEQRAFCDAAQRWRAAA